MKRSAAKPGPLAPYNAMRDFAQTPEPPGEVASSKAADQGLRFVIQKHAARSLHYDFRLELDGTLKSWAVPKGPSLDPTVKRMAVHVEDHPLSYGSFEGTIPPGHYGAGNVIVWDQGTWLPLSDPHTGYREGKLKFDLHGSKLHGHWALVRMKPRAGEKQEAWLLMKERDEHTRAAADYDVVVAEPDSVLPKTKARRAAPKKATTPSKAPQAPKAKLPARLSPQLATLVAAAPEGDDWLWEIKFDGYRLLTRVEGSTVQCFTRNGHDWSHKLPTIVKAIKALRLKSAWLDGEIVVPAADGTPDFQALQLAFDEGRSDTIRYFLFDLPFHAGLDLRDSPLEERRTRLQSLLKNAKDDVLRFSEAFAQDPNALLESARRSGVEGLIGKRKGSGYRDGARSPDWIKLKTRMRQEFVVAGYTDPKGSRAGIGALLLGVHDDQGALRYAGNVGTGFDEQTLLALKQKLDKLHAARSPFAQPPARVGARGDMTPHWVRPTLLAEVSFAQWTREGRIRHSTFHGLRSDKPARQIGRERAVALAKGTAAKVTHAERVIDTASGITKGELAAFYERVAPLMLPHLKDRPVSLLRAPSGVSGQQFFQKHADAKTLEHVEQLPRALFPEHQPLLAIDSAAGLHSAAQMNVIEFHTWNALTTNIDRPDRLVFDLDPGEGVAWPQVQEAAALLHSFLKELGLKSLLKTSGGKGLHVIVPLKPQHGWPVLKNFAQAVVIHLAQVLPQRFVAKSGPKNRVGRIFIDYLRNGLGATTVAAWSARARAGLGVSVPVAWDELAGLQGGAHWTVQNIAARLPVGNKHWAGAAARGQSLTQAMKTLGYTPKV